MTCMRVEGVDMVPYAEILEDRDGPKSDPKTLGEDRMQWMWKMDVNGCVSVILIIWFTNKIYLHLLKVIQGRHVEANESRPSFGGC